MFKLLLDRKEVTTTLKSLLGDPSESLNRDGKRVALKGESMDQSAADQILSDYLADKTTAIDSHDLVEKLEKIIDEAATFGRTLMTKYGAKNMVAGKSDAQIDQILIDMAGIMSAAGSGSLKSAKRQVEAFTPTADVSQEDIDWFVAEISSYLGL